jgi:hypothetical protein
MGASFVGMTNATQSLFSVWIKNPTNGKWVPQGDGPQSYRRSLMTARQLNATSLRAILLDAGVNPNIERIK